MLDDILGEVFAEAVFGRIGRSRRVQLVARLLFGLLGACLGLAGIWHFAGIDSTNRPLTASMIGLFAGMAAFFLFNVTLARRWRWPALLFAVSFGALFVARIAFGR
ncbi:MAG: hypothetical protein AB7L66_20705 [Gemmatimonadales bacterium]